MQRNGWELGTAPNPGTFPFTTADGREIDVPKGVQPGFSYNPGQAHLRAISDRLITAVRKELDAGRDMAAQTTLREIVNDRAFEQFAQMPEGAFPIAILSDEQRQLISASQRLVTLPGGIYRKQLGELPAISRGHTELTIDDYRQLPDLIDNALVIAQQGDSRLIYFSEAGRIWKVVVRFDANRDYPAVVSFHGSSARKIDGETRHLTILLDKR